MFLGIRDYYINCLLNFNVKIILNGLLFYSITLVKMNVSFYVHILLSGFFVKAMFTLKLYSDIYLIII